MGSRTERMLLEEIQEYSYEGLKVDLGGGNGYHSSHDAGDIIVGKPVKVDDDTIYSDLVIIEEKYKSTEANKYLQEDGEKFDAMIEFAKMIGATPVLACRWSSNLDWSPGPEHRIVDAREVDRTPSGNVSVKPETAINKFSSVEEFFGGG